MSTEILQLLLPVIITLVGTATFLIYLFIFSTVKFHTKVFGIPLIVFSIYFSTTFAVNLMGKAYLDYPPDEFALIAYTLVTDKNRTRSIQLWAKLKGGETKLYQFPYSREIETELKEAMERKQRGVHMIGKWKKKRNSKNSSDMTLRMQKEVPKPPGEK